MNKMFRKRVYSFVYVFLLSVFFFVSFSAEGNNIRINLPVKVSAGTGDTLVLEFPLEWSSSWRDEFNWDAAWVFLKYKVDTGDWKHVPLSFGGHSFNDASGQPAHFDHMPGQTGSNTFGLFIYRSRPDTAKMPKIICKLKCLKSALGGMDAGKFASHEAFIRAQAIEMAYVPYGAYYLGDCASTNSFKEEGISASYDILDNYSGYEYTVNQPIVMGAIQNIADHVNQSVYPYNSLYFNANIVSYVQIDFKAPKTVRYFGISGSSNYTIGSSGGDCRAKDGWQLKGSNDLNNWQVLYTGLSSDWGASMISYPVQKVLKVTSPGSYRYYRIVMDGSNRPSDNGIVIQNIAMAENYSNYLLINNEEARTVSVSTGQSALAAAYPKGYKGFYTMKYELSQEQYVAFLNSLSYAQQQERVPGLASMKEGDYIFGDRTQPSNRNGICVAVASFNGLPVLFANNLTNDGKYAQDNDGQTIACNYLSPNDMLAYCSWSGLRPMSELEYEKACRAIYPELALSKGYAWNTASVPGRLAAVSKGGQKDEKSGTSGANVNAGNTFGPVRCGLFATTVPASNQQTAGATFWGVMEMSGNLRELCYNVNAGSTFNGTVLGDGTYAVNKWDNAVANFGVRGGGFSSPDSVLRVSDRTEATGYFTSLEQHDSTVTFRGVYPVAGAVNAGTIAVVSVCPDNIEIKSSKDASSKFDLTYMWYVQKPGSSAWEMMPGETGAALTGYKITDDFGTAVSKIYKFKRKAVALVGEATTTELSVTVPNMKLTLSMDDITLEACDNTPVINAIVYGSPNVTWKYENNLLSSSAAYILKRSHFGDNPGTYQVVCHIDNSGCETSGTLNITLNAVPKQTFVNCGDILTDCEGNTYPTVQIGSQCWMGANINIGKMVNSSDYAVTYTTAGMQRICYNNTESYCDKYGGLYRWEEAMNGGNTGSVWKYVAGSTTLIQGICPDGWRLPFSSEFAVLGGNKPGWNAELGGSSNYDNAGFGAAGAPGVRGSWWNSNSTTVYLLISNAVNAPFSSGNAATSWGVSVRCLLN